MFYNETKTFDKAVEMCDEILKLAPGDANMLKYREQFQKNADLQKAIKDKKPGSGATPPKN